MTGPVEAAVVIPIVAAILLVIWLTLVFHADSHPYWKGRQPPQQAMSPDIPRPRAEPQAPPARVAPAVPGQRVPLTDERPSAASAGTSASTAGGAAAAQPGPQSRSLLLGQDRLQLSQRVTDDRPGRLDHGPPYRSGKRERCGIPGAHRRPPLVATGQPGTDAVER